MLAALLNVPDTDGDWAIWGFAHRDQHELIRQAIQAQYGINLPSYPLDPVNVRDPSDFLNWNQQAHDDMNGVLGVQGADLQQTDLSDAGQKSAWIYLHRREHETAAQRLKL